MRHGTLDAAAGLGGGLGVGPEFSLVGVDSSAPFLSRVRARVAAAPPAVAGAVSFVEGDMRAPAVAGPFDLVAVPLNSLAYLTDGAGRAATLAAARVLVAPDGHFAFDLLAPRYDLLAEACVDPPVARMDADHAAPSLGVKRFLRTSADSYDPATQTLRSVNRYEIHRDDGGSQHRVTDLDWHIWFPGELEAALSAAGLSVVERWGGYDGSPWGPRARQMLWLCAAR